MQSLTVALCQMTVTVSKEQNLAKAEEMIKLAAAQGADIVMLPEMFNCPYDINCFQAYAEAMPQGPSLRLLFALAKDLGIYLIGGSVPELGEAGKLFNTSAVFNPEGELIGKHRKVHLFDVSVKNGINFMESATLSPGNRITVVDTPWGKLGVMICYDIRFPELARQMVLAGAKIIAVPAAFNMTTGPAHWNSLFKGRAIDNQVFMLGNSPARNPQASYTAYGHSLAVSPWGEIIGHLKEAEGILQVSLNLKELEEIREALPLLKQRRPDVYGN